MMLAQAADIPTWASTLSVLSLIGAALGLLLSIVVAYYMKVQSDSFKEQTRLMRQQMGVPTQIAQPVNVTITEELHKVFASKPEFENHLKDFREKHNTIWSTLRAENQRISSEVTATREAIAGLEATTELQNQTLASVNADIKTILGRLPRNLNER